MFACPFILSFPEQRNLLLLDLEFSKGCLCIWGFQCESLTRIPIVRFGEVLNSLFPVESCGNSMCTALLKILQKGSRTESRWSDSSAACCAGCQAAARILTGAAYSHLMDPVWLNAESKQHTAVKLNLEYRTQLLCCVCVAFPSTVLSVKCASLKRMLQVR